jgi:phenylalanyl-tRNA synthetase alpha chain
LSEVTVREPSDSNSPTHLLSVQERDRIVHNAIQHLPDKLRMVTALYFIGSMSQREIAHYLDLSEPVVKKRLHDARKKLKEYIMTMAEIVSTERTPPEQVSAKVIAELVSRPQLLLIHNHPIRMIVDDIQALLPSYELIDSREVEQRDIYPSIRADYEAGNAEGYQLDTDTMLRTQTSGATLRAIEGRTPPIHLLTAGRVYRAGEENENRLNVFHQLDGVYVGTDASPKGLQETMQRIVTGILNNMPTDYSPYDFKWVDDGMEISVQDGSQTWDLGGGGMLKPDMLREAGFDPDTIRGYAFGFGLERMAMLKLGLRNIQDLWKHPYI